MRDCRGLPVAPIAHPPVVGDLAAEQLDETIGNLSARIPAFIDNQSRFHILRAELAVELTLSLGAGITHIDIPDLARADFFDAPPVGLHPGIMPEPSLTADRLHEDLACP